MKKSTETAAAATPKFQQILAATGQAVLDARAQLILKKTAGAMDDHLRDLQSQKEGLEWDILTLTDMSIESTDSLRPGTANFNPKEWVATICEKRLALELLEDEIAVAEAIKEEFFVGTPTTAATDA